MGLTNNGRDRLMVAPRSGGADRPKVANDEQYPIVSEPLYELKYDDKVVGYGTKEQLDAWLALGEANSRLEEANARLGGGGR
jgi:hypothetical protein